MPYVIPNVNTFVFIASMSTCLVFKFGLSHVRFSTHLLVSCVVDYYEASKGS